MGLYKMEIVEIKNPEKVKRYKKTDIIHFRKLEDAKKYLENKKEENKILKEGYSGIIYKDNKTSKLMKLTIRTCMNSNIPKLNKKQVWKKVKTAKHLEYEKSAILDFVSDSFFQYYVRKNIIEKLKSLKIKSNGTMCFVNEEGKIMFAVNKEDYKEIRNEGNSEKE